MTQLPWTAMMIAPDEDFAGSPLLRKEFTLATGHGGVQRAVLRASAFGIYEAFLNGTPVGPDVLSPGWSSYEWRLRYHTYDVTALVEHTSVLGASLGNGWYRGRLGFMQGSRFYGEELGFLAQLDITYADGFAQTIATDTTWESGPSEVLSNDLYDGQAVDARLVDKSWLHPHTPGPQWCGTHALSFNTETLAEPVAAPVVRHEVLKPVRIHRSPKGKTLIDFGQNLVGWLRFTVQGERGASITIRHAEVLVDGELGTEPLRTAKATDTLILSGGADYFEPTKTFHGFRYAEVDGWPGELTPESLEAVVVHTQMQRIGTFSCSNGLLNQLHHNVVWGLRGNFLDLPTDCPQRDERLGWTGDIAVFTPTAAFLYDVKDFLQDWLLDLAVEQKAADGLVPLTIPDLLKYERMPEQFPTPDSTALWSDAAVWVPWALWEAYGDTSVLSRQYDSMTAHTRRVEGLLSGTGLWDESIQLGDWLDPDAPAESPDAAKADKGVLATACFYRTSTMTAHAARILGKEEDAAHFFALAARVKAAFNRHYVNENGTIFSDCATVYSLAIAFDVLDSEEKIRLAGQRLASLARENGYRVSTGFAGTPFITGALSATGHLEEAYGLLLEEECPSWLYSVTMGATTIWERWDSMLPDGSVKPGGMTSFNHYALGAVADWMHKVIGGLSPMEPGYRKVRVAPRPGGGITSASVSLQSPQGLISVSWKVDPEGVLSVEATIPLGVTADIDLPSGVVSSVAEGRHTVRDVGVATAIG